MAARLKRFGQPKYHNDGARRSSGPGFVVTLHPQTLTAPLRWRQPRIVFVNSMSDLFHEEIPFDYIEQVFDVMVKAPQHTFQILTKRDERLAELADELPWPGNVRMGVSVENRRFVHRADQLRRVPAAVRFVTAEPLLGPLEGLNLAGIDWLIAGGESGQTHRPVREPWVTALRDQCIAEEVAFFFKRGVGANQRRAGGCSRGASGRRCHARPCERSMQRSRVIPDDADEKWQYSEHATAKHEVVRRYLGAWLPILRGPLGMSELELHV